MVGICTYLAFASSLWLPRLALRVLFLGENTRHAQSVSSSLSDASQEEYAEENFYFWQSSDQFASSLPTVAKAQTLYDGYIREGAPKQASVDR